MGRIFASLLPVGILVLLCWSITIANGLSVEERLQQLSDQLIEVRQVLKENVVQLEIKDARLEVLEQKVARLELALENERVVNSKSIFKYVDAVNAQSGGKSGSIHRTCREAHLADPFLTSGMNWIDPDGQGVGDNPIYVYCDMIKESTSIPHDSEGPLNVGHCADPGCYSRAINYNATSRQMSALAELSAECHQIIKYDCNFSPFEIAGVSYCWWNDKGGIAKYFWSGNNTDTHTCQCGIDGNCVETPLTCNCDSAAPIQLSDDGVITDKTVLPITRLNFGRTQLETSSGVHTLGRFECTGQVTVTGMPKSCEDLWRKGHTLSGLYSVMGRAMIEAVYCDFNKLPFDSGFQTWIGYADVKSSPTYFYAQRNVTFNETKIPIPFDVEILNVGGAMNFTSGKFTAPVAGKYFFSFTGLIRFTGSSTIQNCYLYLYKNGDRIARSYSDEISATVQDETLSLQSTLNLNKGDQIWLEIDYLTPGTTLNGPFSQFNGFLLEEDISQFVKTLMV
ncbi:uncharacterized protein LOC124208790 isoform X1 [Daphnia pulex]|uniref:uncharacterized protein LOC124208790 isoform X1 n=1 Tax=Daphnia pulex TaxID=6669 RepID=UPI001EE00B05|nr:uncharacterized protein LOC124208790 isoform X1 [Daphnia pulex]